MKSSVNFAVLIAASALLVAGEARANEGQWKPGQIADIHPQASALGLARSADELWGSEGGLLRAAINYGGCSAAFVSPQGLIATNHHCAYGALQANSSVEQDYLRDGFLAATRAEELRAPGRTVRVLSEVTDVSEQVQAELAPITDDAARAKAYDALRNRLVDACEAEAPGRSCSLASFFGGQVYELHATIHIQDVRLVYAPPAAIGEYGGETDNWMWPRHTGDFTLLRAYVGPDGKPAAPDEANIPYAPKHWLEPSTDDLDESDFVAVLGYPGRTDRYMWAGELARHVEQWLPLRVELYGEWIAILERAAAADEAVAIQVAALKKGLANRHKNARGKLAGLAKMDLLAERRRVDNELAASSEQAGQTLAALEQISADRRERGRRGFLLRNLGVGPRSLAIARELVTWADERAKPDLERRAGYRDRDRDRRRSRLERMARDFAMGVDVELLASFLRHADALEGPRIPGFDALLGDKAGKAAGDGAGKAAGDGAGDAGSKAAGDGAGDAGNKAADDGAGEATGDARYRQAAEATLATTRLGDPEHVLALFDDPKNVTGDADPMLALARALRADLAELEAIDLAERGRLLELSPRNVALRTADEGPHYSDANGTLRLSFAKVTGYSKWDGAKQTPQTMLAGAVAKHRDAGEFDLPDEVLAKAPKAKDSRWIDPELGDVPIAFLADGDTTGGNSGSPVVDGQGRLVGFNFDRVWENVAGDYAWRPSHSRNVIADVRYLYWLLDEIHGAEALLSELGVADFAGPPKAPAEPTTAPASKQPESEPAAAPAERGCGCVSAAPSSGWPGAGSLAAALALLGLGLGARRRRKAG